MRRGGSPGMVVWWHAGVAYLLDEREQGSLDGAGFDSRKVEVGQAGGRHGWRGRDCAAARARGRRAPIGRRAHVTWRRPPAPARPAAARRKHHIACLGLRFTPVSF